MSANPSDVSSLVPGLRLDRYELLCPIATGGMAAVWIARLRSTYGFEKLLAIKAILPEYAADVHFQEMLLDEARIGAGIDHSNVAHVFDLGEAHGVLYLVMECVDGDSLGKLSSAITNSGGAFPTAAAIRIVADVCAGLHAAHELCGKDGLELNVVHRDVSPQNILLSRSGVAKVIDFGIARARDRICDETRTGSIKGKIQFMAPEQATGRTVDRRADVWAAGAVLYKLLAGRPPFDEASKFATLHQLASGTRAPPLPAEVPREIADVVDRALAYEPTERFPTALAMRQALEAAMIAAHIQASTNDVADLVERHLSDRTEKRRKDIANALRSAAKREGKSIVTPSRAYISPLLTDSSEHREDRTVNNQPALVVMPERTSATFGMVVSALRPRGTRRIATMALAATAAAILLTATMRRPKHARVATSAAAPTAISEMVAHAALRSPPAETLAPSVTPAETKPSEVALPPFTTPSVIQATEAATRGASISKTHLSGSAEPKKSFHGRRQNKPTVPKPALVAPRQDSTLSDRY